MANLLLMWLIVDDLFILSAVRVEEKGLWHHHLDGEGKSANSVRPSHGPWSQSEFPSTEHSTFSWLWFFIKILQYSDYIIEYFKRLHLKDLCVWFSSV